MTDLLKTLTDLIGKTYRTDDREVFVTLTGAKRWTSPDGQIERIYVDLDCTKLIKRAYFPIKGNAGKGIKTAMGDIVIEAHPLATSHKKRGQIEEIVKGFFG